VPTTPGSLISFALIAMLLSSCSSSAESRTDKEVDRYCGQLAPAFAKMTEQAEKQEYDLLYSVWKRSPLGIDVHEHFEFCAAIRGTEGVAILSTYLAEVASPVRIRIMEALAGSEDLTQQEQADLVGGIRRGAQLAEQLLQIPLK
jgi:hypothetical protein